MLARTRGGRFGQGPRLPRHLRERAPRQPQAVAYCLGRYADGQIRPVDPVTGYGFGASAQQAVCWGTVPPTTTYREAVASFERGDVDWIQGVTA